ncbi:MAG: YbaB/EbfC family nucleoid-associated protein [Proteobacteria bacterium]|nr:YbaB/EbfC family nucleoid-associated protein [Pseudomonadota bacterium]
MTNLGQMLKQAKELQTKMASMQEELADMEITGASGGGMVQVTLNGKGEARKLTIDPALINAEEAGVLEDLILAAFNDAKGKIEKTVQEKMADLTGGLPLPPGMKFPF